MMYEVKFKYFLYAIKIDRSIMKHDAKRQFKRTVRQDVTGDKNSANMRNDELHTRFA
jgi:hypothetical protein